MPVNRPVPTMRTTVGVTGPAGQPRKSVQLQSPNLRQPRKRNALQLTRRMRLAIVEGKRRGRVAAGGKQLLAIRKRVAMR